MTTTKPKLSQWPPAVGYIWHQTSKSCCFEECQKISIQPHWSSTWAEQFPGWPTLFFFGTALGPGLQMIAFCMSCQKSIFHWTGLGNDHNKTKTVPVTLCCGIHLAPDLKIMLFLRMSKNQYPATFVFDMSWTISRMASFVFFLGQLWAQACKW